MNCKLYSSLMVTIHPALCTPHLASPCTLCRLPSPLLGGASHFLKAPLMLNTEISEEPRNEWQNEK